MKMNKIKYLLVGSLLLLPTASMKAQDKSLDYCAAKLQSTLREITRSDGTIDYTKAPFHILQGEQKWDLAKVSNNNWVCGFWPGLLWYDYMYTHDANIRQQAEKFTDAMESIADKPISNHDLGFIIFCSIGNAYKITQQEEYKQTVLRAADNLIKLYNPKVGTILSWPAMRHYKNWPHNTIIDNMMNLEMLFWASKNGGGKNLYDIAVNHALTTMKYHFRKDYSCYHVAVYDTIDGHFIKGVTQQGYSDQSMWARGQSWAIYGFTMAYRETHDARFLDFVQHVADVYLKRLPKDHVPYWDFDVPVTAETPRDVSSACIAASALLELSTYVSHDKAKYYRSSAEKILRSVSKNYQSKEKNSAMLLHSVGSFPGHGEVDASLIYADYYYMEALLRLKTLRHHQPLMLQ